MLDFFDIQDRVRYVHVGEKVYELQASDPYGMWTIRFPKKEKVPARLSGQYTSFDRAEAALKSYLSQNETIAKAS